MTAISNGRIVPAWLVAIVIAMTPSLAWPQTIRLFAGDRAEWDDGAPAAVRLGQPWPQAAVTGLALEPAPPTSEPVTQICCTRSGCVSERNAGIGAARSEVIGRYGASWLPTSSDTRLDYPGISFQFDGTGRVSGICIPHG